MPIVLAVIFLLVGFAMGFLVGTRSSQLAAKMSQVGKAMLSLRAVFNVAEAAGGLAGAETAAGDDDAADAQDGDDDSKTAEDADFLEPFLDLDSSEGLDEHPDIELNPIFMYRIKQVQEVKRLEAQRQSLLAQGVSEEEVEQLMLAMGEHGGGGRPMNSPLAVLISVGARVEAVKGKTTEEMQKKVEVRRKQRNVNVYLTKTLQVESLLGRSKGKEDKGGIRQRTAYDVARETATTPVGGGTAKRELAQLRKAKAARKTYRDYQRSVGGFLGARKSAAGLPSNAANEGGATGVEHDGILIEEPATEPMHSMEGAEELDGEMAGEEGWEESGEEGEEGEEGEDDGR